MLKKFIVLLIIIMLVTGVHILSFSSAVGTEYEGVTFLQAFPDPNFRNPVLVNVIGDGRTENCLITDEDKATMASWTWMNAINLNISDLTGIEYFTGLETLDVRNNQLTELDLSDNLLLSYVMIHNNQLATLILPKNLRTLRADNNQLTELDLSGNPLLSYVMIHNNQLTTLGISNNANLSSLVVSGNNMGFNPDVSIPGWRSLWAIPGSESGFNFYPQFTQDRRWSAELSSIFEGRQIFRITAYFEESCTLIVAFYKNGKFMEFEYEDFEEGQGTWGRNTTFRVPANFKLDEGWTIKIFAWDNMQKMMPIGNMNEINF